MSPMHRSKGMEKIFIRYSLILLADFRHRLHFIDSGGSGKVSSSMIGTRPQSDHT